MGRGPASILTIFCHWALQALQNRRASAETFSNVVEPRWHARAQHEGRGLGGGTLPELVLVCDRVRNELVRRAIRPRPRVAVGTPRKFPRCPAGPYSDTIMYSTRLGPRGFAATVPAARTEQSSSLRRVHIDFLCCR